MPGWSEFNEAVSDTLPEPIIVGCRPVIKASPSELSTIHTLLKRSLEMGRELNQNEVIVILDFAI